MAIYKVLIIDDAFFIRNLIKKAIAKKPVTKNTFEVAGEAQDGRAGIDLCEKLKPDIITVDFNIPTINGLDFAKYLKELHPEIPIIMISSNLDPEFAAKVAASNCKLLTKPFQEAYLWKVLDESVEEILNPKQVSKPKNSDAQRILAELDEEFKGEIVSLKDNRKDISAQELEDKNIQPGKARNVGFDYSGSVLEIKTERRRMSAAAMEEAEKATEVQPAPVMPEIPHSGLEIENDVDLNDEDDYIIDLESIENQRESEYGKTGIQELDDEEFLFIEDEDEAPEEEPQAPSNTVLLDFDKSEDELDEDEDGEDDMFLIEDDDEDEAPHVLSEKNQKCEELLSSVTFNYYDYLGGLLYSVQNATSSVNTKATKEEVKAVVATPVREETQDEEFDRLFREFNGGQDVKIDNAKNSQPENQSQQETVLTRNREHISIDPPKDSRVFQIYGAKLENVTSSETMTQMQQVEPSEDEPVKKKGFFARLFEKLFGGKKNKK